MDRRKEAEIYISKRRHFLYRERSCASLEYFKCIKLKDEFNLDNYELCTNGFILCNIVLMCHVGKL